jgi:hypothetical protein
MLPHPAAAPQPESLRAQHVALIGAAWRRGVEAILETGARLIAAKAELAHGEFQRMVRTELPFGTRVAQTLMAIARHPVLSNVQFVAHLPASYGTLYELTQLPEAELLRKFEAGEITPKTQRPDVAVMRSNARMAAVEDTHCHAGRGHRGSVVPLPAAPPLDAARIVRTTVETVATAVAVLRDLPLDVNTISSADACLWLQALDGALAPLTELRDRLAGIAGRAP